MLPLGGKREAKLEAVQRGQAGGDKSNKAAGFRNPSST